MTKATTIASLLTVVAAIAAPISRAPAQGADPFAHYTTPAECAIARIRMENQYWRARRQDTMYSGPLGHPAHPSSIARVRACVSRFSVDKVPQRDLLGLGYAYLAADQDRRADTAFTRLVMSTAKQSVSKRGWTLAQIVKLYTTVAPVRLAKAREYMAKLDALGASAAMERMLAHNDLAEAARVADSIPLFQSEAEAAVQASAEISADSVRKQRSVNIAQAYVLLATVAMRRNDAAAAVHTLERAVTELTPVRASAVAEVSPVLDQFRLLGKPAPAIKASTWYAFQRGEITGAQPEPGKVTTLTFATHNCGGSCYSVWEVLRRLATRTDGVPLNVVLAIKTEGYYRTELFAPAKESDLAQKYFLDFIKIPGVVGVWHTNFGRKTDGRLDVLTEPNERAYKPMAYPGFQTYVVDKQGKVRFISNAFVGREYELDNVIKSLK